ncbi:MAG: PEP-CTERM sorting domain-containing protein [Spirulina sp. DLM2.Bin59]|nr:MAG: PEP-CTERM sorting domain-containing protein [Spirulina sp. DLM2.Bin59]
MLVHVVLLQAKLIMLKTKLLSGFITVAAVTISIVGIVEEAISSPLYLTPGETGTVQGFYWPSASGQYDALIQWNFLDGYVGRTDIGLSGVLKFVEDSLFEESRNGTQYQITNDAISSINPVRPIITYRPMSAQNTPGGETTAGLVDWSDGGTISMSVGIRTLDIDSLFTHVKQLRESWSPINSIQDMHNLWLGEVRTQFTIEGHTSSSSRDLYLDLSNYSPPTDDNSQKIPEPTSVIALLALTMAGLTSIKKNCRSI